LEIEVVANIRKASASIMAAEKTVRLVDIHQPLSLSLFRGA
jgi:hypothetical protein